MIQKLEGPGKKSHHAPPKVDDLRCTHFRFLMTQESMVALHHKGLKHPLPLLTKPDGSAGKMLILNSATTFDMLSEYHLTLLNHQAYAEHHHYAYVLALVKPVELGRSAKFAKHLAMGTQLGSSMDTRSPILGHSMSHGPRWHGMQVGRRLALMEQCGHPTKTYCRVILGKSG